MSPSDIIREAAEHYLWHGPTHETGALQPYSCNAVGEAERAINYPGMASWYGHQPVRALVAEAVGNQDDFWELIDSMSEDEQQAVRYTALWVLAEIIEEGGV